MFAKKTVEAPPGLTNVKNGRALVTEYAVHKITGLVGEMATDRKRVVRISGHSISDIRVRGMQLCNGTNLLISILSEEFERSCFQRCAGTTVCSIQNQRFRAVFWHKTYALCFISKRMLNKKCGKMELIFSNSFASSFLD